MAKIEMDPKVEDALVDYYQKTGANIPPWLAGEGSQNLQQGEVVTLPAPKPAAPKG